MAECSIYNSDSIYDSINGITYVDTYLMMRKSDCLSQRHILTVIKCQGHMTSVIV